MDAKFLTILAVIIVASGCAQNDNTSTPTPENTASGNGLEINEFRVADKTLTPGQETNVLLELQNYHTQDINITDISLYNLGLLDAESRGCSPEEINSATSDIKPRMECNWRLEAPEGEEFGGFEQRPLSFNLHLEYDSVLTNTEPVRLQFKPLEDVNSTEDISTTFSNGEVEAEMSLESPATFEGRDVRFEVSEVGPGRTDSNYTLNYEPDIFSGCPEEERAVIDESFEFTCQVQDSSEVVRNLFFSTRYKYVKEPTVDVTLVRPDVS